MKHLQIALKVRPGEKLTDFELLTAISSKASSPLNSVEAFNEFYLRYYDYVWKCSYFACEGSPDRNGLAKDIFQNTFIKVKLKASLYKKDVGVKGWLGTIVRNEFIDIFRSKINVNKVVEIDGLSEEILVYENENNEISNLNRLQLESALAQLSERDRDVILTYFRYHDPLSPMQHLPENEIKYLTNKYNTTSTNLRKIKQRALKKLESILKN